MGHFRLGCDSPPSRFLQTRSCKLCPSKRTGGEDASIQKLLDLQRWPRHRLGGCSDTHTDDPGQRGRADHPVGLFRLLYRLGVNDDCPIRLSAAKALGVEPPPGVISSIDPPCGPLADDTQLTPGLLALIFFRKSWPKGSLPLLSDRKPTLAARTALQSAEKPVRSSPYLPPV